MKKTAAVLLAAAILISYPAAAHAGCKPGAKGQCKMNFTPKHKHATPAAK